MGAGIMWGLAAVMVAAVAACGGDDDSQASGDGSKLGQAVAEASEEPPSNVGTAASTTTSTTAPPADVPELPPPTIPSEASPPTTAPGTEADEWPIGLDPDDRLPLVGDIVVDLEPNGHRDFPVALQEGEIMAVMSAGDDGIMTHIEIFRPDGTSEGSWQGGEEGVINGWEWVSDGDRVPMTGTYVFRVIHLGGSDEPFLLRFFAQP